MPKVNLEVTGFYYRREVEVPEGTNTVKAVMEAARMLPDAPDEGRLDFISEVVQADGKEFVKTITVLHEGNSAASGQKDEEDNPPPRVYEPGLYVGQDDGVKPDETGAGNGRLVPVDPGLTQVRAWQYYVYDNCAVDLNRKNGPRRIVPYNRPFADDEDTREFKDGDTIVWRQVTIAVGPTFSSAPNDIKAATDQTV